MEETNAGYKVILIVGVVAVLFVVALTLMAIVNSGSSNQTAATSDLIRASEQTERQIAAELLQLRNIKLDGSIFTSPEYTSLQDFSRPIKGQPVGRPNPFAPINENDPELRASLR